MTIRVGLDISLKSPGIAIHDLNTDTWSLFCFAQRASDFTTVQSPQVHVLPAIPSTTKSNVERYEHIRKHLVDNILMKYREHEHVHVNIESYAFGAKNSGSSYKLQELGGVLKHSLWIYFPTWTYSCIPPTQWKKRTIGHGNATKSQVIEYVQTHGPCLDLCAAFGVTANQKIPSPIDDLADAICFALSLEST